MLDKIKLGANYFSLFTALAMVAVLPFYYIYQRVVFVLFFTAYVIDFLINSRWKEFCNDRTKYLFFSFIFIFLLLPVYHLFERSSQFYLPALEVYLSFAAFGVMGLFGFNKTFKIKYFAYTALITAFVICAVLIFGVIGVQNYIADPNRAGWFAWERCVYVNSHMVFNLFLNATLVSAVYLLFSADKPRYMLLRIAVWLMGGGIYYILFISDGRTGFLTANIIVLLTVIILLWRWKKLFGILAMAFSIVFMLLLLWSHTRFSDKAMTTEPRLGIWRIAAMTIAERPVLGYGVSDGRVAFLQNGLDNQEFINYENADNADILKTFVEGRSHPHNQFMQMQISFGVVGLLLMLFVFVFPIVAAEKKMKFYVALLVAIFLVQSQFESFGIGCPPIIYLFFLNIFLNNNIKNDCVAVKI